MCGHWSVKSNLFVLTVTTTFVTATLWNKTTDALPPLLPKECMSQRLENNNYTFVDNGQVLRETSLPGYSYASYQLLCTLNLNGGYNTVGSEQAIPQSMVSWSNYSTSANSDKATLQLFIGDGYCQYWAIEGGTPYMGYDYYANEIVALYDSGTPVYYTESIDEVYGVLRSYTVPLMNNDAIVNYTTTYTSDDLLLDYTAEGHQYCCLSNCAPKGTPCREGGESRLAKTYSNVRYTDYVIYPDNYTWPNAMYTAPPCPYSTQYCGMDLCNGTDGATKSV